MEIVLIPTRSLRPAMAYSATYDTAGNLICRALTMTTSCSGATPSGQQLSYDAQGRLSLWQDHASAPTQTVNYLYDGSGSRVATQSTADAKFAKATSWEEMLALHRSWMHDYNVQRHWVHEEREDGRHSPASVLGGHKGTVYPASVLDRILFTTRYTRHLDKHGFLRFQNWKFYGERGLAKAPMTIWVYEGPLKIEYKAVTLSKYTVKLQDDQKHLQSVSNPRLVETPFRSPQLTLIDLGPDAWLLHWRTPDTAPARRKRCVEGFQMKFTPLAIPLSETFTKKLTVERGMALPL